MKSLIKDLKGRLEPILPQESIGAVEVVFEEMLNKCISFYTEKEAVVIVDRGGNIVELDQTFHQWFGEGKGLAGGSFEEIFDEMYQDKVAQLLENVHTKGYAQAENIPLEVGREKLFLDLKAKEITIDNRPFVFVSLKNKVFDYVNFMLNEIEREVANLIVRVKMLEPLLQELLEIFIRSRLFDFGWVAQVDMEHQEIVPIVSVGDEEVKAKLQDSIYDFSTFASILEVLINKDDLLTSNDLLSKELKSQIIFPLFKKWGRKKEHEIGYLVLVASKKRLKLDESERVRLKEVMYKINVAISNILLQTEANALLYTDPLTSLPMREEFFKRLQEWVRNAKPFVLVLLDVDRLVKINNVLGFWAGDEVLKILAQFLMRTLSSKNFIARIGTDEFALLLKGDTSSIYKELDKILSFNEQTLMVDEKKLFATISAGAVFFPEDAKRADELFLAAETALAEAKKRGGKQIAYVNKNLHYLPKDYLDLEYELKEALKNNEYELFYQPIIDSKHKKIWGVEALLRWNSPKRGLVSPGIFIPILEESGLINDVGEFILDEICNIAYEFKDRDINIVFSMNLSVKQLFYQDMAQKIIEKVQRAGIDPKKLVVEMTESVLMENIDILLDQLDKLHQAGIKIEIDDFGTGYSSLSYLKNLPISNVKIDRAFIKNIDKDEEDRMLVQAIVSMTKALHKGVIAEGVETKEQLAILQELDVALIQGFFFAKPMPKAKLKEYIQKFRL